MGRQQHGGFGANPDHHEQESLEEELAEEPSQDVKDWYTILFGTDYDEDVRNEKEAPEGINASDV